MMTTTNLAGRTGRTHSTEVLIVEDQPVMRALLRDFLQSNFPGLFVIEVGDGGRALKIVRERAPRVVLLDIQLPDGDGIELTARFKALRRDMHVIVVTNTAGSVFVDRALAAGALALVQKNKIHAELLPIVAHALGLPPPGSSMPCGQI